MDQNILLDTPIEVTEAELAAARRKHNPDRVKRSDQELRWLIEYLGNGNNAKQAALTAGYTEATAPQTAYWVRQKREDSQKKDFWDVVRQGKRRRLSHLDATRERVMLEYTRIALFDPAMMYDDDGNILHPKDMPEDARRAIAGFEVNTTGDLQRVIKMKMNQKNAALKDLSVILGITKETVVHEHKFSDLLKQVQETNDPLVVGVDPEDMNGGN